MSDGVGIGGEDALFDPDRFNGDEACGISRLEPTKLVHRGLTLVVEAL